MRLKYDLAFTERPVDRALSGLKELTVYWVYTSLDLFNSQDRHLASCGSLADEKDLDKSYRVIHRRVCWGHPIFVAKLFNLAHIARWVEVYLLFFLTRRCFLVILLNFSLCRAAVIQGRFVNAVIVHKL